MSEEFKTWAIVQIMGHQEYAGFVSSETIAGAAMLRIDVPAVDDYDAFTKYVAPAALYGISPCTEETARLRAKSIRATPFQSWDVERMVQKKMQDQGLLIEDKTDDDLPF